MAETEGTKEGAAAANASTDNAVPSGSNMITCPVCSTELEPWQIKCHGCGQSISSFEIPVVKGDDTLKPDLAQAFSKWMRRGRLAFKNGSYDEAHACYAEALKRVVGLEDQQENEIKARVKLADSFVKLNKLKEAVEQLVRAAQLTASEEQKETLQKRVDSIHKKIASSYGDAEIIYRVPKDAELMSVPLYCASCHRLLSESEVYRYRPKKQKKTKCICGIEAQPLTLEVVDPQEPVILGPPLGPKKAQLIDAAHQKVEGGRDRTVAIWLAVLLGGFGAHKFYLGERGAGIVYLLLSFTLIPWMVALYEALHFAQMTSVSFNLVYNTEAIIQRLPLDTEQVDGTDFLSMEISDDPEDLVDAWSHGDEVFETGSSPALAALKSDEPS